MSHGGPIPEQTKGNDLQKLAELEAQHEAKRRAHEEKGKALQREISQYEYRVAQHEAKRAQLGGRRKAYEEKLRKHQGRDIDGEKQGLKDKYSRINNEKSRWLESKNIELEKKGELIAAEAEEIMRELKRLPLISDLKEAERAEAKIQKKHEKNQEKINAHIKEYSVYVETSKRIQTELKALIGEHQIEEKRLVEDYKSDESKLKSELHSIEVEESNQQSSQAYLSEDNNLKIIQEQLSAKKKEYEKESQNLKLESDAFKNQNRQGSLYSDSDSGSNIFNPPRTFTSQAPKTNNVAVVSQNGIAIKDIIDYLSDNTNISKLNRQANKTLVNVEKSLQQASGGELKLELVAVGGEKSIMYAKTGKSEAGIDSVDFFINKEAKDDVDSINLICKIAVFSASEKNKSATFQIKENHPHADKIRKYLSDAILEVSKTNPDLAAQFKVGSESPYQKGKGNNSPAKAQM